MKPTLKEGDIVLITYYCQGIPIKRICRFKYWDIFENPVLCPAGNKGTQSSFALRLTNGNSIKLASEEEIDCEIWEK